MSFPISTTTHVGKRVVTVQIVTFSALAVGEARCHPDDTFDVRLGTKLATARAHALVAEQLFAQVDDAVFLEMWQR